MPTCRIWWWCSGTRSHQVRINPGNFADGRKTFEEINYDDPKEFAAERAHIEEVGAG